MSNKHRPPPDTEMVGPAEPTAPGDIGLGAPVVAQPSAISQGSPKGPPLDPTTLLEPERKTVTREEFLKRYPLPSNVAHTWPPKQFQTAEERARLAKYEGPQLGKLAG
jgi:hypothetical protein